MAGQHIVPFTRSSRNNNNNNNNSRGYNDYDDHRVHYGPCIHQLLAAYLSEALRGHAGFDGDDDDDDDYYDDDDGDYYHNNAHYHSNYTFNNHNNNNSSMLFSGGINKVDNPWKEEEVQCSSGEVTAVAFSPCGTFFVTGGKDRMVRVWDAQTFHGRSMHGGHELGITYLTVLSDCQRVISASRDMTVRCWHLPTGNCKVLLELRDPDAEVHATQDGRLLLISDSDGSNTYLINAEDGQPLGRLPVGTFMAISPDWTMVVGCPEGANNSVLSVWSMQCSRLKFTIDCKDAVSKDHGKKKDKEKKRNGGYYDDADNDHDHDDDDDDGDDDDAFLPFTVAIANNCTVAVGFHDYLLLFHKRKLIGRLAFPHNDLIVDLSQDGERLAVALEKDDHYDVCVFDIAVHRKHQNSVSKGLADGGACIHVGESHDAFAFSADGKQLLVLPCASSSVVLLKDKVRGKHSNQRVSVYDVCVCDVRVCVCDVRV